MNTARIFVSCQPTRRRRMVKVILPDIVESDDKNLYIIRKRQQKTWNKILRAHLHQPENQRNWPVSWLADISSFLQFRCPRTWWTHRRIHWSAFSLMKPQFVRHCFKEGEEQYMDAPRSKSVVQKLVCPFKKRILWGIPLRKLDSRWWRDR